MIAKGDSFSAYDDLLAAKPPSDPWAHDHGQRPVYEPDHGLLGDLLTVPVRSAAATESGAFANAVDAWTAHELRRAGFDPDEVWPRSTRPRVLPRDIALLLSRVPAELREELARRVGNIAAVAPVDARILGRAYEKQVDVVISRWDRGPELLISTKAQLSSFGKNLPNRFEEAYGDSANLRGRHPLAAIGYLFVQRDTIVDREPDAFERSIDMIRKLREVAGADGYTATGLVLVGWDGAHEQPTVRVRTDLVPEDVAAAQFFDSMIDQVLRVTPVAYHVKVRELRERRSIAL